jgi:glyceraldehyde-3-phosphate dehydrogenase (NADP+)
VPETTPVFLAGRWVETAAPLEVRSPYDESAVGRTWIGGLAELEEAAAAAAAARQTMARLAAYERAAILRAVAGTLGARRQEFADRIVAEAGKPVRDALVEVDRAVLTFGAAADESLRLFGEQIPLDLAPHGVRRFGITRRVPAGPVAAISPFNFPLNLVAHKLAPAIAAGDPVVLKPATKTPLSALALARLIDEAGLPKGGLSVLPLVKEAASRLVADDRFAVLTFTGSAAVGWQLKSQAGRKRVILELGGNAGVIVDRDAPVERVVKRLVAGGFAYAGQSCISVQRVYAHEEVFDALVERLVPAVEALRVGDPRDPATDLGSLIDDGEAARVDAWVREAVEAGARVLTGGRRIGRAAFAPTVLTNVPATAKVCREEAFAPLVGVYPCRSVAAAIDEVNRSRYGLQAGVFTNTLAHALDAFDRLEVGGVILNDVPSYRMDHMPYGGVKDSGLGREGPRYTIEELTELRLLVVTQGG